MEVIVLLEMMVWVGSSGGNGGGGIGDCCTVIDNSSTEDGILVDADPFIFKDGWSAHTSDMNVLALGRRTQS